MATLLEGVSKFVIVSCRILLRMTISSTKHFSRNQNTRFFFDKVCLKIVRSLNNVEKYRTTRQTADDNITWCMRFAWWITKAAYTHLEYVIIIAFPQQQWLREQASVLRK